MLDNRNVKVEKTFMQIIFYIKKHHKYLIKKICKHRKKGKNANK